ncbi:MAG: motility protein A [Phycisphaerae bacterium]|nr:motility protein A [Phycisphaerae bacterium]|tara:strand:- start:624 stop:1529 length:906 start_codon:yes stop_codon:yes gene_type:complete
MLTQSVSFAQADLDPGRCRVCHRRGGQVVSTGPRLWEETVVDLSTLVGLIIGSVCVGIALLLGGSIVAYVDPISMLIVIGGASAATLTSVPLARFLTLHRISFKTLMNRIKTPREQVGELVELAEVARRDGILAMEQRMQEIKDPFLLRGIQLAVDGVDPDAIEETLQIELDNLIERHEAGRNMFEQMGKYAPAFGMIGTLIGLVAMLSNMEDPSAIGAGMAAALLTTLYGALLANLVFLPLADKLENRTYEESLSKQMIIQGIKKIQLGDNPRNVEMNLRTFLAPSHRSVEPFVEYRQAA